jgi:antitoxin (DNA-binding transcriptional repressor) of toxin-antitoxin stability system
VRDNDYDHTGKAQQELPALIKRVLAGEETVIGAQDPAVRLTPVTTTPSQPDAEAPHQSPHGHCALKGQLVVGREFFEPLNDEECGIGRDPGTP